eukprot:Skav223524  [mRNA]  locus=scaffold1160:330349:332253:+ [translate_table: standard]
MKVSELPSDQPLVGTRRPTSFYVDCRLYRPTYEEAEYNRRSLGLELFFSPASRESAVVPQASIKEAARIKDLVFDTAGTWHPLAKDLRSGFLEDSIKDLWPQVTTQLEALGGAKQTSWAKLHSA